MSESLTNRQQEVFDFIQRFIRQSGMPPTRAEIAQALGFRSPNAADDHLKALQRKGAIALKAHASRGIRLLNQVVGDQMSLPLVGRVAAGEPILAQEHIERHFDVDASMFNPTPHYLLEVHGMSMINAGILDGDLVAVHRSPDVRHNQIIVARIEDEVTVKRYRQKGKDVWLMPENDEFAPIHVDLTHQELMIEGVVVGVIRRSSLH